MKKIKKIFTYLKSLIEQTSEKHYQKRIDNINQWCRNIGADMLCQWFIDFEHLDCFWYRSDTVASISYKGCSIDVCVRGETYASIEGKLCITSDGRTALIHNDEVLNYIQNDTVLHTLERNKELNFFISPWVEIGVFNQNGVCIKAIIPSDTRNVLTALEREFNNCINCIDMYAIKEKQNNT